jgi:alanyl-tRNA synthetase
LTEAGRLLSAGLDDVPDLISKQMQDLRDVGKAVQQLVVDLAGMEAMQLWQQAPEIGGVRVAQCVLAAADAKKAKFVAQAMAKQPEAVALIGVNGAPTALFFAQTPGGKANVSDILKQTVAKFGGRGGGTRDFAQGGGLPEEQLESALIFAASLLPGAAALLS